MLACLDSGDDHQGSVNPSPSVIHPWVYFAIQFLTPVGKIWLAQKAEQNKNRTEI